MKKLLICLIVIGFSAPSIVFADALGSGLLQESVGGVGLESNVETSIANIISAVLAVTGTVFLILTVSAGIMWMTASGNEDKIAKAKKMIIGATIGLAICLFAYLITYFISSSIAGGECDGECINDEFDCIAGPGSGSCESGQHCCK